MPDAPSPAAAPPAADPAAEPAARAAYHHGDLQATLQRLAVAHIAEEGTEAFSLRGLAREAGVSPAAFYRHFPSRQHLLAAIATAGFDGLREAVRARVDAAGPCPEARLFACGQAYVGYAVAHPVHYHLMFGSVLGDFTAHASLHEAAEASYGHVRAILADGLASGQFAGGSVDELGGTIWSGVHGIASILIDKGPMAPARQASAAMRAVSAVAGDVDGVLRRLMAGLRPQAR